MSVRWPQGAGTAPESGGTNGSVPESGQAPELPPDPELYSILANTTEALPPPPAYTSQV